MNGWPRRRPEAIMQPQNGSSPRPDPRDELAGVYVEIEAEEQVFLPPSTGHPRPQREPGWTPPTTDELAGVYIYVEAEEQVYLPTSPPNDSPPQDKPTDSAAPG
jgi:hypothetical protein